MTNSAVPITKAESASIHTCIGIFDLSDMTGTLGSVVVRNGFGKDGFQQRAAGRVKEQPALLKVGEVHRRVADAEMVELLAKVGVAFHSQADVIDRLGGAVDPAPSRANEVDERTALGIEPMAGNAAYGERSLPFFQIEDGEEETQCRLQIPRADGDVIEVHVIAPFATETRA